MRRPWVLLILIAVGVLSLPPVWSEARETPESVSISTEFDVESQGSSAPGDPTSDAGGDPDGVGLDASKHPGYSRGTNTPEESFGARVNLWLRAIGATWRLNLSL